MRYLSATANTITNVQLFTGIASVAGLFFANFTATNILITVAFFYIYSILGISITLHRYYTHKAFEFKHPALKWLFTLFALLAGRASILGWVYVHRLHHTNTDNDKDPHSPLTIGYKLFGFKHIEEKSEKMKIFLVKDLMTKEHIWINNYYLTVIIGWIVLMGLVDPSLIYFTWILPAFIVQLSQNNFNYFAHKNGYRNFETKDMSTNNAWLFPFILGDAWHNNHHGQPAVSTTQVKWWEIDPAEWIISLVKKA